MQLIWFQEDLIRRAVKSVLDALYWGSLLVMVVIGLHRNTRGRRLDARARGPRA